MNKNKYIKTWFDLGVGRGTALSVVLRCSRQYVNKISKISKGISESAWSSIGYAVELVELDEMKCVKKIEQNILKAARLSHSNDVEVKQFAQIELDKWVELLGEVKK